MGLKFHPGQGSVVLCDYSTGFMPPEMVKRRPVIVLCKKMKGRPHLCTVVPLSTTAPDPVMDHHAEIELPFSLPRPFTSKTQWIKGDMVSAVSLDRLLSFRLGKAKDGKRIYLTETIGEDLLKIAHDCVIASLGID
ncbi:MAG: type II toxin-antitoxin system PemK/MazF family toxin [Roseibium sp.]|nr:type II toxin-antitoxin system PemK/MazF family toxin [Roseibium sp.]